MIRLEGPAAFSALADAIGGQTAATDFRIADPTLERMRQALEDKSATAVDLAVLVRHTLLHEAGRRNDGSRPLVPTFPSGRISDEAIKMAGLEHATGIGIRVAEWRPSWLASAEQPPDARAAWAPRRRFGDSDRGPAVDPFLRRLGRDHYRSVGQRAAVRSALLTPPRRSIAIDLPTGEGKSLVFQAINLVGFASSLDASASAGVTLVIVPTVALAYDHENACRLQGHELLAYAGSDVDRKKTIRDRLAREQSGLVFAPPEAACASLRPQLLALAEAGRLKAIVVDEAHLVDAWGTGFRPEFQSLSGLRSELLERSPENSSPRTILLSATLTPETLDTLESLFASPDKLLLISAAQVRPEPDYYVAAATDEAARTGLVEDALLHVPRPAILYVTEVRAALDWQARLRQMGFGRFAVFYGDTSNTEKERTLRLWRDGALDLVVATSAFGLGIDYLHVRSVLHACVPETFDRFYQEVGRSGRDGCASLSLALPSHNDFKVATGLNRERVITCKRGLERWMAMFRHASKRHLGGMRFRIRLDVAPGSGVEDIDLVGERSLQWNARVLTLMTRAGLLRLIGGGLANEGEVGCFETVEILDPDHTQPETWARRVEPVRAEIARARKRNLALMRQHLRGGRCPSDLVRDLYGHDRVRGECSCCALCRADPARAAPPELRLEPSSPWPAPDLQQPVSALLRDRQLVVTYQPGETTSFHARRAAKAVEALLRAGVRCVRFVGATPAVFERAIASLVNTPVFLSHAKRRTASRLPSGPELVFVGDTPGFRLGASPPADPRIIFLPEGYPDADRAGDALIDRYNGAWLNLDLLLEKVAT